MTFHLVKVIIENGDRPSYFGLTKPELDDLMNFREDCESKEIIGEVETYEVEEVKLICSNLVKVTDTSGKNTGTVGKVTYQALTDKEEDNIINYEGDASYIGYDFDIQLLGDVYIPSLDKDKG